MVSVNNVNSFCSFSLASVFLETSKITHFDVNNFPVYHIFKNQIQIAHTGSYAIRALCSLSIGCCLVPVFRKIVAI